MQKDWCNCPSASQILHVALLRGGLAHTSHAATVQGTPRLPDIESGCLQMMLITFLPILLAKSRCKRPVIIMQNTILYLAMWLCFVWALYCQGSCICGDYCFSKSTYLIALFIMFDFHFYCALKNPFSGGLQEERSQSGFFVYNKQFSSTRGLCY